MNPFQWLIDLFKPKPKPPAPTPQPPQAVADRFDGAGAPNPTIWTHRLAGSNRIGTTDYLRNAWLHEGNLTLRAIRERATDPRLPGQVFDYTTAALVTKGKVEAQFGTWSATIFLPAGRGTHPTFALFGHKFAKPADWPACGEIDIMEVQATTQGCALNGPGYDYEHGKAVVKAAPGDVRGQWHTYSCRHEMNRITISIDGAPLKIFTPADLPRGTVWVYNQPMFAWIGLGIGTGPNAPALQSFPQDLVVSEFSYEPLK